MMILKTSNIISIREETDLISTRHYVRNLSIQMGFSLVDQTRLITAVSELTRNALVYGGGGIMTVVMVDTGPRHGIKLIIADKGPGIVDIDLALQDGYSTGHGLGNGLGGSKRLLDEFEISSEPGKGTTVTAYKWLP